MPRGGARPNSGGKRPGAGRPRKEVKDWQSANLTIFRSVFTPEDVRLIAGSIKADMAIGNTDARKLALAYIIGAAPKEVTVLGDSEAPVEVKQVGGSDDHIADVLRVLAEAGVLSPRTADIGNATTDEICDPSTDA